MIRYVQITYLITKPGIALIHDTDTDCPFPHPRGQPQGSRAATLSSTAPPDIGPLRVRQTGLAVLGPLPEHAQHPRLRRLR